MYQINNYNIGEYARVNDFSILKNWIKYTVFAPNKTQIGKGEYSPINSLREYKGTEIIPEKLVCDALVSELFGEEWETSTDLQCWQKGILEKSMRFYIPNGLVLKAMANKLEEYKDFKPTLDYMVAAAAIDTDILIKYTDTCQIIYSNSIDSEISAPISSRIKEIINADGTITVVNESGLIIQEYKKI